MKATKIYSALIFLGATTLLGCTNDGTDETPEYAPGDIGLTESHARVAESQNSFAWNFMGAVADEADGHKFVVSPLSMVYALSMVANGADGATLGELTSLLGSTQGIDELNGYCQKMLKQSQKIDKTTTVTSANCVEVNKQYKLNDEFREQISDNFYAKIENCDFSEAGFADYLNSWCSKQTNGMITNMFDDVDPNAMAYIINALYFKGKWREKFNSDNTSDGDFYKSDGTSTQVKMMRQTSTFKYYDDETMQLLSMDYGNGSYSMQLLLPRDGKTVADIIAAMKQTSWKELLSQASSQKVKLRMPRFSIEFKQDMSDILKSLGTATMFTDKADFSRMSDAQTYVSAVIQNAKIEVDESGTKAAAITEVGFLETAVSPTEPIVFTADHPFIFVISEHSTSTIFFIGQFTGE